MTEHVVRSWNAYVLMPSIFVRRAVRRHPDVDVWLLQESHRRRRALSRIAADFGLVLYMPEGRFAGGNPILVRDTLTQEALPPLRMKRRWPRRRLPGIHPPRTFTAVLVEGIEYIDVHLPERFPPARPARIECVMRLREHIAAAGHPVVAGGDWNGRAVETGRGLPGRLIQRLRLAVGDTGRIDFFVGRGVRFTDTHSADSREGSDHHAVQTVVTTAPLSRPGTPTMRVVRELRALGVDVLTRRDWGSREGAVYEWRRANKPHHLIPQRPVDTIVQHITVTHPSGDFAADCRTVEQIGMDRFGSGVSYNFLVDMTTGRVAIGQPVDAKGTHTVNDKDVPGYSHDQNAVALAIAVVGMPGTPLSAAAEESIARIQAALIRLGYCTDHHDYDPHSKFAWKDCPCDATRDRMPAIRARALELAAS